MWGLRMILLLWGWDGILLNRRVEDGKRIGEGLLGLGDEGVLH